MKAIFTRILVGFTLLARTFGMAGFMPVRAAPLAQWLNPDGTLNLNSGYTGNLDISNYRVSMDPARGPVLRPRMAPGAWSALDATPLNGNVNAIVISGTDVYVGGQFIDVGGDPNADYIAKWDALTGSWSALGTTPLNNSVYSLAVNGTDVYVGGIFTNAGGDPNADLLPNGMAQTGLHWAQRP